LIENGGIVSGWKAAEALEHIVQKEIIRKKVLEGVFDTDWPRITGTIMYIGMIVSKFGCDVPEPVFSKMMDLIHSDWFIRETEGNSEAFIKTAKALDLTLRTIREKERKAA
jgi:hypothetical protein